MFNFETVNKCRCGRQLKQSEVHFYGNRCTDCVRLELLRIDTIDQYNEMLRKDNEKRCCKL